MPDDVLTRFAAALPRVVEWIDDHLTDHAAAAKSVASLELSELSAVYPDELLAEAKVVLVPSVPFPPLESFGLPEFGGALPERVAGLTLRDTFFVGENYLSPSLCFHEMVHIVQWRTLGPERFLWVYGLGLAAQGYRDSPLEEIAFRLTAEFDEGRTDREWVPEIEAHALACWEPLAELIPTEEESAEGE